MSRTSQAELLRIEGSLAERERRIIVTVERFGLMTQAQIAAVEPAGTGSASTVSRARVVRRTLRRLVDLRVLSRLARRIGGVRAGSGGFVYYVGPVGQRLLAYWNGDGFVRGRGRDEPGSRYVNHLLGVAQIYVDLVAAQASGELEVLGFDPEPASWRRYLDGFGGQALLKPDAYVRLGVGAYEDRAFLELDLGTESQTVIARKLRADVDYFQTGEEQTAHGVFPRVVLLTNSERRRDALTQTCSQLPPEQWHLFQVGMADQAAAVLVAATPAGEGAL